MNINIILNTFFTLEGIDGAGTTTQLTLIKKKISDENYKGPGIFTTFEPTSNPIGKFIRQCLKNPNFQPTSFTYTQLFACDRREHLIHEILPEIKKGHKVICDRYLMSSLVYQEKTPGDFSWDSNCIPFVFAEGINDSPEFDKNQRFVVLPKTVFFIDTPVEIAQERIQKRGSIKDVFENIQMQNRFYNRYKEQVDLWKQKNINVVIIDGTLRAERIHSIIWEILTGLNGYAF